MSGYTSINDREIGAAIGDGTPPRLTKKVSVTSPVAAPVAVVFERQSSVTSQLSHNISHPEEEVPPENDKKPKLFGNRRDKFILFAVSLFYFSVMCAYAMIAPFFPGEVGMFSLIIQGPVELFEIMF